MKFSSPDPHRAYLHAWEHLGGGWVFATCPLDRRLEVGDEGKPCPYGTVGDRLWVREAWRTARKLDDKTPKQIAKDCKEAGYSSPWCPVMYEADGARDNWCADSFGKDVGRYRAARFMPKWVSRITLEIVEIRAERLHEITEEEAVLEGIESLNGSDEWSELSARAGFADRWNEINGKRGYPWEMNPWVWVLGFKKIM